VERVDQMPQKKAATLTRFGGRAEIAVREPRVQRYLLRADGVFPNNEQLPLLVYQSAVTLPDDDPASVFEQLFGDNQWGGSWRNGIYKFHHYHSTAHEVLGCFGGYARVQLGGPSGVVVPVEAGDVLLIPAGVAHKNLEASPDFKVVGAYPQGQSWDMNYGKPEELAPARKNIARVALPKADPVYGRQGPLTELWTKKK